MKALYKAQLYLMQVNILTMILSPYKLLDITTCKFIGFVGVLGDFLTDKWFAHRLKIFEHI